MNHKDADGGGDIQPELPGAVVCEMWIATGIRILEETGLGSTIFVVCRLNMDVFGLDLPCLLFKAEGLQCWL